MEGNDQTLLKKLNSLKRYSGTLNFSIGEYYIQFQKEDGARQIYFEALSHNYSDLLSNKFAEDFSQLGFQIDDGNYYKSVSLVDNNSLESIVQDSRKIFEDIYRVNYQKSFEITDDIERPKRSALKKSAESQTDVIYTPVSQPFNFKPFLVIGGFVLLLYFMFFSEEKKKVGSLKIDACLIAQEFIKEQLLSPKNADFGWCDQSKSIHLGNDRYQVTNYVDASNAFGASIRKNFIVIMKFNGGKSEDINRWTFETFNIE